MWSLVGEESLAATVLQLYWKKKYAADKMKATNAAHREKRQQKKAKIKQKKQADRQKVAGVAARKARLEREARAKDLEEANKYPDEGKAEAALLAFENSEKREAEAQAEAQGSCYARMIRLDLVPRCGSEFASVSGPGSGSGSGSGPGRACGVVS